MLALNYDPAERLNHTRLPSLRPLIDDLDPADLAGQLLSDHDRQLFDLVRRRGIPHRFVARVLGVAPSTVSRQVQRLLNTLHHPVFRALVLRGDRLQPDLKALAVDHFCRHRSIREIAAERNTSYAVIRGKLDFIVGWASGFHLGRHLASQSELD